MVVLGVESTLSGREVVSVETGLSLASMSTVLLQFVCVGVVFHLTDALGSLHGFHLSPSQFECLPSRLTLWGAPGVTG